MFFLLLIPLFSIQKTNGQVWQWARQSDFYYANESYQSTPLITTDNVGNVYAFGTCCSIYFGTYSIAGDCPYYPGHAFNAESMFLVKYDSMGNVKWLKEVFQGMPNDSSSSWANAIVTDGNGNIYLTGSVRDSVFTCGSITIHKSTPIGYFLIKLDSNGTEQWVRSASGGGVSTGWALSVDLENNIYVSGYGGDSARLDSSLLPKTLIHNIFLAKYDPAGNVVQAKSLNGAPYIIKTINDSSGGLYVSGSMSDTLYLDSSAIGRTNTPGYFSAKLDASFNVIWECNNVYVLTTDIAGNIYAWSSNESSITSDTSIHTNVGFGFFVKYNPGGGVIWAKPQSDFFYGYGPIVDDSFNIYMADNLNLDSAKINLIKYDSFGNRIWVKTIAYTREYGLESAAATSLAAGPNGSVYLTGNFSCFELNFGNTTLYVDSSLVIDDGMEEQNIFLAKLNTSYNDEVPTIHQSQKHINIFPNPTSSALTISAPQPLTQITITNLLGQTLFSSQYYSQQVQLDVSTLTAGIYFVKVNGLEVKKFIKL